MEYVVLEKNKSQLNEQANYLNSNAWPKFVDGEKVMRYYWGFIEDNFPDYQLL